MAPQPQGPFFFNAEHLHDVMAQEALNAAPVEGPFKDPQLTLVITVEQNVHGHVIIFNFVAVTAPYKPGNPAAVSLMVFDATSVIYRMTMAQAEWQAWCSPIVTRLRVENTYDCEQSRTMGGLIA